MSTKGSNSAAEGDSYKVADAGSSPASPTILCDVDALQHLMDDNRRERIGKMLPHERQSTVNELIAKPIGYRLMRGFALMAGTPVD